MQTRILLLRHAESTHPHVFNGGESDVPLSPRGRRQALALGRVLAPRAPYLVVSSAMQRAVQTAQPIAEACGTELRIEPELHERNVGELRGKTNQEAGGLWTETLRRWKEGDLGFSPPGAESFLAVQRRALAVWERLAVEYAGRTIVVVAHGHVCRVLLLSLLSSFSLTSWEELGPIRNASITELLHSEAGWEAIRFNEVPAEVEQVTDDFKPGELEA
jgi:2,3-bisphosphoglycerate-dependent phosphoglycerate mutase